MKKFFALFSLITTLVLPAKAFDSGCFLTLTVYPSPYMGTANTIPGSAVTDPNCTGAISVGHGPDTSLDYYNAAGNPMLTIRDGDIVSVQWPTCCDTGWGIAAEGQVQVLDHGVLHGGGKITLSIPNWNGVIPIAQNSPTNSGPGNLIIPPFSIMSQPPTQNPPPAFGYNGCAWKAHIVCHCDGPPGSISCEVSFEVVGLMSCMSPHWVLNAGCPFPNVLIDPYGSLGNGWVNTSFPPSPLITVGPGGLQYQWCLGCP